MEKIALITDSGGDLSLETLKENNINLTPFRIIYSECEFEDGVDITPDYVYKNLHKEIPMSSLPNLDKFNNLLNKLADEGYTHTIVVTISCGLSGTWNSLRLICEDFERMKCHVYDSKFLCVPQGQITLNISRLINEGKSFNEIISTLPKLRSNVNGYFTIGTLEYLQKGGRIGRITGSLGELLQIKPIVTIDQETGDLFTVSKVRGSKKAYSKLISLLKVALETGKHKVWVLDGGAKVDRDVIYDQIKDLDNIVEIRKGQIGPIFGMHVGPGLVAITWEKAD